MQHKNVLSADLESYRYEKLFLVPYLPILSEKHTHWKAEEVARPRVKR